MTADRDLDRELGSWFEDVAIPSAPDGLLERSLARVDATRQRTGWLVRDRGRSPRTMGSSATTRARVGRLLAIAVAVVVVAIGAGLFLRLSRSTSVGPSSAPLIVPAPPQTIHVLEPGGNDTDVSVGKLTGCTATTCQGDYSIGDDALFDAVTSKQVGTILFECFVVDAASGLYHCPGITIDLTGRGQIVYTANVYIGGAWQPEPWPITGGTGEFLGATGSVTSPQFQTSSGGDYVITITK
jgi:hypothetical protein